MQIRVASSPMVARVRQEIPIVSIAPSLAQRILDEGAQPLQAAARDAGLNPPPSLKTLLRWSISGVRGRKLETIRVGGRIQTSAAAVRRLIAATQPQRDAEVPVVAGDRDEADRILTAYGIGRSNKARG